MARIIVRPRIGVKIRSKQGTQRDMRDILGVYDQMVWDSVAKKYFPALRTDLLG
jgi:hypothetical protein